MKLPDHLSWLAGALLQLACASTPAGTQRSPAASDVLVFTGACDASGAVVLDEWLFAVGDDEDNILRVYDGRVGGAPVASIDVSPMLGLFGKKRPPELDVEAATGMGDLALWLTSHGRKSSGKLDPARLQLFATSRPANAHQVTVKGSPYVELLTDLLEDRRLEAFGLAEASTKPPKSEGGLNLEAMTETLKEGSVLIGFRSPIPHGKALVVPLLNPTEVVNGARARLGDPKLLDLGGRGMRSLSTWHGRYLIVAGSASSGGASVLFEWDGFGSPRQLPINLGDLNPEAFVTPESQASFLVLSDDGSRLVDGVECKRLKDPSRRSFRGLRVSPVENQVRR
jgi:hypothetical protein